MAFQRDGSDPIRGERIGRLDGEHRLGHSTLLATGTLACPHCDLPVAPGEHPLAPSDAVACAYCGHVGVVRNFLSLATPARPAYVEIRLRGSSSRA
jgi:hypothetical protein